MTTIIEVNCETGETIQREMTEQELAKLNDMKRIAEEEAQLLLS